MSRVLPMIMILLGLQSAFADDVYSFLKDEDKNSVEEMPQIVKSTLCQELGPNPKTVPVGYDDQGHTMYAQVPLCAPHVNYVFLAGTIDLSVVDEKLGVDRNEDGTVKSSEFELDGKPAQPLIWPFDKTKALVGLYVIEHVDNDIGKYDEIIIVVGVTNQPNPGRIDSVKTLMRSYRGWYVEELKNSTALFVPRSGISVSTSIAQATGVSVYGLPKTLIKDVNIHHEADKVTFAVYENENEPPIIKGSLPKRKLSLTGWVLSQVPKKRTEAPMVSPGASLNGFTSESKAFSIFVEGPSELGFFSLWFRKDGKLNIDTSSPLVGFLDGFKPVIYQFSQEDVGEDTQAIATEGKSNPQSVEAPKP